MAFFLRFVVVVVVGTGRPQMWILHKLNTQVFDKNCYVREIPRIKTTLNGLRNISHSSKILLALTTFHVQIWGISKR